MFDISLKPVVHYLLHLGMPFLLMFFFPKERRRTACLVMLATMLVDADHLLANPIFDPGRCSVGYHPLHSYFAIAVYFFMCFLPYEKWKLPWWLRVVGIGLMVHMATDWQDFYLWAH